MKSISLASLFALAACGGIVIDPAPPPPPGDAAPSDVAQDAGTDTCWPAQQDCSPTITVCRVLTDAAPEDHVCDPDAGWTYYLTKYPEQTPPNLPCSAPNPISATCPGNDTCMLLDGTLGFCATTKAAP